MPTWRLLAVPLTVLPAVPLTALAVPNVLVWLGVLLVLVIVGCGIGLLSRHRLFVVAVHGTSMLPTYQPGERLLAYRGRRLAVGQVVVARHPWDPGTYLIKRIAALPTDAVPESVRESVRASPPAPAGDAATEPVRVPAGSLVLLGDNTRASFDSRRVGYFAMEAVLGRVLFSGRPRVSEIPGAPEESDGTRRTGRT